MLYAAYGIFTNDTVMNNRIAGHAEKMGPSRINGWLFNWRGTADIEPVRGESIDVLVWDIDDIVLQQLDSVEGYPFFYDRIILPTSFGDAFVYSMVEKTAPEEPGHHMFRTLEEGYLENNLDIEQIERPFDWIVEE